MNHVLTDVSPRPSGLSPVRAPFRYRLRVSNEVRTFAQVLKEVLDRDFGGSNADFARAAGINIGQVGRYLGGQTPRPSTVRKMAPHMGISYHRLMDLAERQDVAVDTVIDDQAHPYAVQINLLLSKHSDMPADERRSLEQVINTILTPYRKYLGGRKTA